MVNTHSTGVKCQSFITSSHGYCNLRYSVTNNLMFLVRYLTLYLSFLPRWLKVGRTYSTKPRKSRLHRDLQSHNLGFSDKSGWSHELRSGYTMLLMFFLFLTPISFISIPLPSYWCVRKSPNDLRHPTRPRNWFPCPSRRFPSTTSVEPRFGMLPETVSVVSAVKDREKWLVYKWHL